MYGWVHPYQCHFLWNSYRYNHTSLLLYLSKLHNPQSVAFSPKAIGRFSEAGLHEWMPFVIFCERSHERSQHALPGRFLSRRCFTLCITVEVEPRIAKQDKCHHCCSCKNYREKGMEGGKSVFALFLANQKIASSWKKYVLGHQVHGKNTFWGIL